MAVSKKRKILIGLIVLVLCVVGFFVYVNLAFPKVRCEAAKHLESPDAQGDCVACHIKATPKDNQDWTDSKHGVMLVKCYVCHGQPDGKGAVPFLAKPDYQYICSRCHEPAMKRMEEKYGQQLDCNTCHPNHQNPVHRDAYQPQITTDKTTF